MALYPTTTPYLTGVDLNGNGFRIASEQIAAVHIQEGVQGVQIILNSGDKINAQGLIDELFTSMDDIWTDWIAVNSTTPATTGRDLGVF